MPFDRIGCDLSMELNQVIMSFLFWILKESAFDVTEINFSLKSTEDGIEKEEKVKGSEIKKGKGRRHRYLKLTVD